MKKLTKLFAFMLVLVSIMTMFACQNPTTDNGDREPSDADVIMTISAAEFDLEGKTLKDYMDHLVGNGELTYVIADGMITEINGTKNGLNSYWMLYTDDAENSNTAWGTYEVGGKTYASAALGAAELTLKDGCTYIFTYQTF